MGDMNMFDKFIQFFKTECQLSHFPSLVQQICNVLHIVKTDFTKDSDNKNAAIDAICDVLKANKDKTPIVEAPKDGQENQTTNV